MAQRGPEQPVQLSGIALGSGLDDRGVGARNISLHHRVQTGSGAHLAPYPMDARGSFPRIKVAGMWSWQLTSIQCRGQECMELYLYSSNIPSWRGAQLKHRDNFTFTLWRTSRFKKDDVQVTKSIVQGLSLRACICSIGQNFLTCT
jgi:hypothetical protein